MKAAPWVVATVALCCGVSVGQEDDKGIRNGLDAFVARLSKGLEPKVVEVSKGQWKRSKMLAVGIKMIGPKPSDYADKPHVAFISWGAQLQDTRIYGTEEQADKADDWQKPGRVVGMKPEREVTVPPDPWRATLYRKNGQWVLESLQGQETIFRGTLGRRSWNVTAKSYPQTPWWHLLTK